MTLSDDIFRLDELKHTDGLIIANLSVNVNSSIFKGHFPGQPVVPGACILQMVKDVLEIGLGTSLLLRKAANLKFISMISPADEKTLYLEISYKLTNEGNINTNTKLTKGEVICFKLQGIFIKE